MLVLVGECNRCGRCCEDKDRNRCEHLIVGKRIGEPEATRCGKYKERYDRMPIRVLDHKGRMVYDSVCFTGSYEETVEICKRGIGRGCSLKKVNLEFGE